MLCNRLSAHSCAALLAFSAVTALFAQQPATQASHIVSSPVPMVSAKERTTVIANYLRTPLSFEANQGQAAPGVDAIAHGPGYTLMLSEGEATLRLDGQKLTQPTELRLQLLGESPEAQMHMEQKKEAISNYFLGNDPGKWHTDIPNYERIRYAGIYQGIDLLYYGNGHGLEHDFVVAPGADPARIQIAIAGAKAVRLNETTGDLVLATDTGDMRLHKPESYQTIEGRRVEVASEYAIASDGTVSFHLAHYDSTFPLVIDPELSYSTLVPPANVGGNQIAWDPRGFGSGWHCRAERSGCCHVAIHLPNSGHPHDSGLLYGSD